MVPLTFHRLQTAVVARLQVIEHWFEELKARVPIR
jgi:hypothetical protein